jgi:hypothetical protein
MDPNQSLKEPNKEQFYYQKYEEKMKIKQELLE